MHGPWLPIYGSGAVVMLFCASPFMKWPILVFLSGFFGASILEFFTGMCMEAIFKVRYWDYSNKKFNIKGHVCLLNSIYWGLLTILLNYWIHMYVDRFMNAIPYRYVGVIVIFLSVLIGADFGMSFKAAMDMRDILIQLDKARDEIEKIQKRLDVLIAVTSDEVHEELNELKMKYEIVKDRAHNLSHRKDFFLRRLIKDNPTMASVRFKDTFEVLKHAVIHKD